jgi:addiction module HigA family antidote
MKGDFTVHRIRTHPGDILRHELEARSVSANQLALALGVPSGRIVEILNRKRGISADTALRLARYIGTSAQFWMNLQAQYDLSVAQEQSGRSIEARVQPADGNLGRRQSRTPRNKVSTAKRRRAAG